MCGRVPVSQPVGGGSDYTSYGSGVADRLGNQQAN
ncbi:hypothetical protein HAT87_00794 [Dickeya solani]|uniref:Uncharacterized protein n=1 Tax=Dickeya solani D s0432-1 TaxID=1231725 RepID=A0AAV3KG14_9GAMM|nr:hypothetical protein DSOL99_00794 [Dickeya solani]ERO59795.1 hypothetical protein A544_0775 [Dickeya solani D s0432-1]NUA38801.1 hypothetical protein [Dickeya solani]QKO04164.1 hypothetical protein HAT87_00794 [Dickeya solani]QKO08309.1 hypothetical protein HAT89_00793 [Dickeya solani]